MSIREIHVNNIKSFKNVNLKLGNFNVFIGGNASGKTNFISILKFISYLKDYSFDDSLLMLGGIEYFKNLSCPLLTESSIRVVSDTEELSHIPFLFTDSSFPDSLTISSKQYKLTIDSSDILFLKFREYLRLNCFFVDSEIGNRIITKLRSDLTHSNALHNIYISLSYINGKLKIYTSMDNLNIDLLKIILKGKAYESIFKNPNMTLLRKSAEFEKFSFYDFDPRLAKNAMPLSGKVELSENGENLALVINKILRKHDDHTKFITLIRELLPFITDLSISKLTDKSVHYIVQEKYFEKDYFHSSLISDGTANILAIVIAIFFNDSDIIVIEEPEKNIHPYLLNKLIDLMKDASRNKQIIITTHNPEIVKHAGIENLYLITRNNEGISDISKPASKKRVKMFLKEDMGLDDLYVENLLG